MNKEGICLYLIEGVDRVTQEKKNFLLTRHDTTSSNIYPLQSVLVLQMKKHT
jgi:hypothetical protein